MVINNLDIYRSIGRPHEAHAKLVIDADAVLSGTTTFQRLQAITGRHTQVAENSSPIKLLKFPSRGGLNAGKSFYALSPKQAFGIGALEGFDGHELIVTWRVMNVNIAWPAMVVIPEVRLLDVAIGTDKKATRGWPFCVATDRA